MVLPLLSRLAQRLLHQRHPQLQRLVRRRPLRSLALAAGPLTVVVTLTASSVPSRGCSATMVRLLVEGVHLDLVVSAPVAAIETLTGRQPAV